MDKNKKRTLKSKKRVRLFKKIGLQVFFVALCLVTLIPVFYAVSVSFNANNSLISSNFSFFPEEFTFDNYIRLFTENDMFLWFGNSLLLAFSTVILALSVSIPAAYAFSRMNFKGKKTLLRLLIILNAFPTTLSLFAIWALMRNLGLVNSKIGLILIYTGTMAIFGLWNLKGYFDTVPYEIEEAAMIDGASNFKIIKSIVMPLAKPAIVVTAVMILIYVWNEYIYSVTFMTGSDNYTLAAGLYGLQANETSGSWPLFAAASLVTSLPILIIFLLVQRHMVSGLSAGGVKKMRFDPKGVLHIQLSNYAFAIDGKTLCIRLRVSKDNVKSVTLFYGDTASRTSLVNFTSIKMNECASDESFTYFECLIENSYQRVVYYFEILDLENKIHFYYADNFYKEVSENRNDLYKFPYIRKEDVGTPPSWLKNTTFYNIFPDSFVSRKRKGNKVLNVNGCEIKNKLGGTIKDIISKLDYIKDLGFNGVYINPLFMANEYHKYDVIDYFKIDPLFGTNKDFKNLVDEIHKRDMKIVIDLVLNHSGWYFFAFDDVIKNQEKSIYKDWFYGLRFPIYRPKTREEIPPYDAFGYERNMPKLNTDNEEVIEYFKKLVNTLLTEFKVDGFRLDTSDEVNDYFWICLNREIKKVNKEAVLIGEIWENPEHWLNALMFDSAMNYELRKTMILFFKEKINVGELKNQLVKLYFRNKKQYAYSLLNILSTHDTPRFYSLVDKDNFKYKAAYSLLYFLPGSISVLYGEEQPVEGIKECDYRQAINFKKKLRFADFFKKINEIRRNNESLIDGSISINVENNILKIEREFNQKRITLLLSGRYGKNLEIDNSKIIYSSHYSFTHHKLESFGVVILA